MAKVVSMPTRRWLRVAEVAELMKIHPTTVRKMLMRRELAFVKKRGFGVLIDWPKVERQLERSEIVPEK